MTDWTPPRWLSLIGKVLRSTLATLIFCMTTFIMGYNSGRAAGFEQAMDATGCLIDRVQHEPSRSPYCLRMEARLLEKD